MAKKLKATPYSMAKAEVNENSVMTINLYGIDDRVLKALPKKVESLIKASDPSAVGRKSRNKGGNFERGTAKKLNSRFSSKAEMDESGKPLPLFSRTPRSGGFLSNQQKSQLMAEVEESVRALSGDLIAPKAFKFNLELKNYKNSPLLHKLYTKGGDRHMNEWVSQSRRDAVNEDMFMIIFHIDVIGDFCVFPYEAFSKFATTEEDFAAINNICITNLNCADLLDAVIVPLDELLTLPDSFFFNEQ